jgi:DNA-binding Lrp family transcriptional regulator
MSPAKSAETDISPIPIAESVIPGELDLALINALQLRPRATWAELAEPLSVTANTLARRWKRMSDAGLAWVTAAPGRDFTRSGCTAFVLIRSRPSERARVVAQLVKYTEVASVEVATGNNDIVLDVLTPDLRTLDRFLNDELNHISGIRSTSIMLATSLYLESSRWRLRSLDASQLDALNGGTMSLSTASYTMKLDNLDHRLLDLLVRNGRLTWIELAQATDCSTATARRRVERLVSSGIVTFRCEIAQSLAGWPIQASLLAKAPAKDVDAICQQLATWPACRLVAAVTGEANVYMTFWVHNLGEIQRLETTLSSRMPTLDVTERMIALNTPKRMGHLCDNEGRHIGVHPIAPW